MFHRRTLLKTSWKIRQRSEWQDGCQESQGMQTYLNSVWDPGSNRENPQKKGRKHRLNMEKDLKSLFGPHVHSCTHLLRPRNPPPLPHLGSYTRVLLFSQDRRHLFVTQGREEEGLGAGRYFCWLDMGWDWCLMVLAQKGWRIPNQETVANMLTEYHVFSFAENCVV